MKKFLALAAVALALGTPVANAAEDMTFADWIGACGTVTEVDVMTVPSATCVAYTRGVLDAARLTEQDSTSLFCDPRESMTTRDYIEIGQKWAADNSAGMETNAAFQLMLAFKYHLPCEDAKDAM